jgi:hypothetical protein
MRILQLTILAIVFLVVSGLSFFLIEIWSGGRLQQWRSAPFTGTVGDECLAIELATLPVILGVLACSAIVRLFRLRSVHNEISDTLRPILTVATGYGRFLLIIVSGIYLVLGHGWVAFTHLAVAVVAFAVFYGRHRARERAVEEGMLRDREEEEDETSLPAAQVVAPPNGGRATPPDSSGVAGRQRCVDR